MAILIANFLYFLRQKYPNSSIGYGRPAIFYAGEAFGPFTPFISMHK
jgi:hypothetical protein